MAKNVTQLIQVAPQYQVRKGAVKQESGLAVQYQASAIFDFSALDSSGVANSAIGAHGLGVFLPIRAIVTRAWFQTVTGFTSAGNTAQIALSVQSANDLKTATVVSNAAYVAAGLNDGVPVGTAATSISLTAQRELTATVSVQALTAGKLVLYVEYTIGS